MTLSPLRADALISAGDRSLLRVSLPWIRSLPVSSLVDPVVRMDGRAVGIRGVRIADRCVPLPLPADEDSWWFQQDRLSLELEGLAPGGSHEVSLEFGLRIPYLQVGPDGPLTLRFHDARTLEADTTDAVRSSIVLAPRGAPERAEHESSLPPGWVISASSFNWTPDMIGTDDDASDITAAIVEAGLAREVEAEPGQLWRSFPGDVSAEAEALRTRLDAAGGALSIMGASIDDWSPRGTRRDEEERLAFLLPQLEAAQRLGARGVRLPIGHAGSALLERVRPILHEKGLIWFEEIQGQQTPGSPQAGAAIDRIVALDDPNVRLLVDISMLMPAVPESYLGQLEAGGVPSSFIGLLRESWRDPDTAGEVFGLLRRGEVPDSVHTLFMDMIVRFGRSDVSEIADLLPWIGAFHLKFWDLADEDDRVSGPIRALGALLAGTGFQGTFCSEWGGQEWLDDDPARMTRDHMALARAALIDGANRSSRTTTDETTEAP